MIHTLVQHVVTELDDYMKSRMGVGREHVVAASLLHQDGLPNQHAKDRVVASAVNIEADPVYHAATTISRGPDGTSAAGKPAARVNVYLLFVGNFTEYSEALKAISLVIAFFQSRPAIEFASIPDPEKRPHRVTVELVSPTFEQQNHLWGMLGARYMPCVLYKARQIAITDETV